MHHFTNVGTSGTCYLLSLAEVLKIRYGYFIPVEDLYTQMHFCTDGLHNMPRDKVAFSLYILHSLLDI